MKLSERTDKELILGCQKGKAKSQEMLYKKYYGYAMGVALRYAPTRDEASEILNDSFLKVFQSAKNFDLEKSFKPWLGRIVVNTAISKFRSEKKHMYQSEIEEAHQVHLDEDVLDCMAAEEIIGLLQSLPDIYRITFNLYELEGYSHKEIAEQLGITEGTSRSNLSRAKSKLQKLVNEHYRYERA